jgi:rhamnosyltransferase
MKIGALVILYDPPQDCLKNILSYYKEMERIFIYDNTERHDENKMHTSLKDAFLAYPKIEYFYDAQNKGIAVRLNEGCKKALENGFDWLLTMDQDSRFLNNALSEYIDSVNNFKEKNKVALFGTAYSRNSDHSFDKSYEMVDDLITSGMMINLQVFKQIGPFDENLFIDSVDHDYCIRAKILHFDLIKFTNIHLLHELGQSVYRSSIKSLFIFKKRKIIHSPLRCYYMLRNLLYLENKFAAQKPSLLKNVREHVGVTIKKTILYGRAFLETLRYVAKAKRDFRNNRMGKLKDMV